MKKNQKVKPSWAGRSPWHPRYRGWSTFQPAEVVHFSTGLDKDVFTIVNKTFRNSNQTYDRLNPGFAARQPFDVFLDPRRIR
jgi:hypothetical protein